MVKARCKFTVSEVKDSPYNNNEIDNEIQVKLHTLYDPNDPEDTKFSQYTPVGEMSFYVSNPNVIDMFVEGRAFYVDLIPVSD